jgi:crotonobetaine/carnitine-CoA ligase
LHRDELERLVLGNVLEDKARTHRSAPFLKLRDGELSHGEVDRQANQVAQGLAAIGVRRHAHVALMLPNGVEIVVLVFALARLGAVAVPINTDYKGDLLEHVLNTSDSTMLVIDERWIDRYAEVAARAPRIARVVVRGKPDGKGLATPPLGYATLFDHGEEAPRVPVRFSDLQAIMYTSGTTGPSKGVMVPHALALTCATDSIRFMAHGPEHSIYCPTPLFHAGSLWDGMLSALIAGSGIGIVERFSASRFWDDVRYFDASLSMGVFAMIPILLNQPPTPRDRDHPLKSFYMGKSDLDAALFERFGVRAVETYTSTEIGIGTASPWGEWRTGSCGTAWEERFEVAIVDAHDHLLGPNEAGELVVRPKQPYVMTPGYYNFGAESMHTMRNLWFHTGDMVRRDDDGYYYFLERLKDSIRCRGENISAFEVERAINAHPAVLESAAFGILSELTEDELAVAVVLRRGETLSAPQLADFCAGKLPAFMVPRFVEFTDALPKTPNGKVAKYELRRHGVNARTWDRLDARPQRKGSR